MRNKIDQLLEIAKPYGVKGIHFSGCKEGQDKGFKGAMRRSAHAHNYIKYEYYGWICFKQFTPEKKAIDKDGYPTKLFWHEVVHIFRRSYTEKKCNQWAWRKHREYKQNNRPLKEYRKPLPMNMSGTLLY